MDTCWVVQYNDGTQKSSKAGFVYQDIDRDRLIVFALCRAEDMKPLVVLHLSPERKLIYRKRATINHAGEKHVVYLVGWQQLTNCNRNVQMLTALFEDGHIEVTDGFKEDHPWFGNVNLRPEEKL